MYIYVDKNPLEMFYTATHTGTIS